MKFVRRLLAMKPPRLVLAVVLSVLAHLFVLFGNQVDLSPPPDLANLDVRLVRSQPDRTPGQAPRNDVPPKPPKPKPKPEQVPESAIAEAKDPPRQAPRDPQPEAEQRGPEEPETPAVAEEPVIVGSQWPKSGRITFAILMGEQRFQMGRSIHQWEVAADNTYRIQAITEPTGVASIPWFRPESVYWESKGRITEYGLQPGSFIEQKSLKGVTARGDLDWEKKIITLGGQHSFALPEGTQDLLSLFYQLGYPGVGDIGTLPITTGKRVEMYQFELIGAEDLAMPFGQTWRTLHIRARYGQNEMTEVWTAQDQFGLPVQIRIVDRKGVVYYMLATEVLVDKGAVEKRGDAGSLPAVPAVPLAGTPPVAASSNPATPLASPVPPALPTERPN